MRARLYGKYSLRGQANLSSTVTRCAIVNIKFLRSYGSRSKALESVTLELCSKI